MHGPEVPTQQPVQPPPPPPPPHPVTPHAAEQAAQLPHVDATQSTGQTEVRVSDRSGGHAAPPFDAGVTIERLRLCKALPVTHGVHAVQTDTTQATGSPTHSSSLHAWLADSAGHGVPPLLAGVTTVRDRDWTPPPQSVLQVPHTDHVDTWHGTGVAQIWPLQPRVSDRLPHGAPPLEAGIVTPRVRTCTPPPQDAVQLPQPPQAPATHATGAGAPPHSVVPPGQEPGLGKYPKHTVFVDMHGPEVPNQHPVQAPPPPPPPPPLHAVAPHATLSTWLPHATPSPELAVITLRARMRVPPPHKAEQLPHAAHVDNMQSTPLHSAALHPRLSASAPQAVPPFSAAVTTARLRDWTPPPHVAEHAPHPAHVEATQATGQSEVRVSDRSGGHAAPPFDAGVMMARVRLCEALPDAHAPQAVQPDTTHATPSPTHPSSLHARLSDTAGHAVPPLLAAVTTARDRDWAPPPQSALQVLHTDHDDTWQSTGPTEQL